MLTVFTNLMQKKLTVFALTFLLFAITLFIYLPGLNGSFEFDDIANIIVNKALVVDDFSFQALQDIAQSRSNNSGSGRPISFLSFALNINTTGFDPYYFKLSNLLIHICNGFLVFIFIKLLLARGHVINTKPRNQVIVYLALASSALWLVHPIQLTSVLYIVQRMNSLSALFLLLTFIVYLRGRERSQAQGGTMWGTLLLVSLLTALAVLSKENGALAPLFLLIIETYSFKFKTRNRTDFLLLVIFFCLTLGLLLHYVLPAQPVSRWSEVISGRHFSLSERLLTELRVVWLYVSLILTPVSEHFAIFHDYWPVSRSLINPISTLISLVALVGSVFLGLLVRHRYPFLLFGVLWFLAGHIMESAFIPLELIHEHRNYLPSLGILFALVLFLYQLLKIPVQKPWHERKNLTLFMLCYFLCFAIFSWTTYQRSVEWSSEMRHAIAEVKNHPDSARANYQLGRVLYLAYKKKPLQATYFSSSQFFNNAIKLSEYNLNAYIGYFILLGAAQKPLDQKMYQNFLRRLEQAPLRSQSLAYIESLNTCQMQVRCPFTHQEFMQIFKSMNANKQLSTGLRNELKRFFADYINWHRKNAVTQIPLRTNM
ncbi:MAG: hypothetical protein QNL62_13610 [Gammaproteobacteria bacterium]|nr:hypothetical protein [Gammaproteobacteria bacterium]